MIAVIPVLIPAGETCSGCMFFNPTKPLTDQELHHCRLCDENTVFTLKRVRFDDAQEVKE